MTFRVRLPILLTLILILTACGATSEVIPTQQIPWAKTYGGEYDDGACDVEPTGGSGYIVAGYTDSSGADRLDFRVLKLDESGIVHPSRVKYEIGTNTKAVIKETKVQPTTWAKTYGGTNDDAAWGDVEPTSDGGYIVAGYTQSFGAGDQDVWVLKLDRNGNILWQKTYGGTNSDWVWSIKPTSDGGYIVAGCTQSFGAGYWDVWVLKLDRNGNILWQKTYGGTSGEGARGVAETSDGGYIIAGVTESFGAGDQDVWVLKLDRNGNILWQKTYGGTSDDWANCMAETSDGGYIVAGYTQSFGAGYWDVWVLKLDRNGNILWQKTYGGTSEDRAYCVAETSDGGYIVAGYTQSFGAGYWDVWVLKLDRNGNILWQKTYGGTSEDRAYCVAETSDGGYIVAGYTQSFGAGDQDVWVLKLDRNGNILWQKTYGGTNSDRAWDVEPTSDGGYIVAGHTQSFGAGDQDVWVLKLDGDGSFGGRTFKGLAVDSNCAVGLSTCKTSPSNVWGRESKAHSSFSPGKIGTEGSVKVKTQAPPSPFSKSARLLILPFFLLENLSIFSPHIDKIYLSANSDYRLLCAIIDSGEPVELKLFVDGSLLDKQETRTLSLDYYGLKDSDKVVLNRVEVNGAVFQLNLLYGKHILKIVFEGDERHQPVTEQFTVIAFKGCNFNLARDSYSFSNWSFDRKEFKQLISSLDIMEDVAIPLYAIASYGGHCYGMSFTASAYFTGMLDKPVDKPVFLLSKKDALYNINLFQLAQVWIGKGEKVNAHEAYQKAKNIIDEERMPLVLNFRIPTTVKGKIEKVGHSILVIGYYDSEDTRCLIAWDSNLIGAYVICKYQNNKLWYSETPLKEIWILKPSKEMVQKTLSLSELTTLLLNFYLNNLGLIFKSPIDVTIATIDGRTLSIVNNQIVKNEIEEAYVYATEDLKIIVLPKGTSYNIKCVGIKEGEVSISSVTANDGRILVNRYKKIPVMQETIITFKISKEEKVPTPPIEVDFNGDGIIEEEVSKTQTTAIQVYAKRISSLHVQVTPSEIKVGEELTLTGRVEPPTEGLKVRIVYTKAGGVEISEVVSTDRKGYFKHVFGPNAGGTWKVYAECEGVRSNEVSFEAVERRCIIATATYGSELAPQVQYLRGFRETVVYQTYAGSQFMKLFNAFYYSWSPYVASLIWKYPVVKPAVQAFLTPLFRILHLATLSYSILSFNSEIGIVVAGLVACSLIGLTYFTPPTTLILLLLQKRMIKTRWLKPLTITLIIGITLIMLGEATTSATLTMIATGLTTTTTIALTACLISIKIATIKPKIKKKPNIGVRIFSLGYVEEPLP